MRNVWRKRLPFLVICVLCCQCICCAVEVNAKIVTMRHSETNKDGRVFKVNGNIIYYKRCTGSDPETWGKTQKAKLTAATRYYEMKGYLGDKLKLKTSTKQKAMKSARKYGNYNWFRIKNGKVISYVYKVEHFVG